MSLHKIEIEVEKHADEVFTAVGSGTYQFTNGSYEEFFNIYASGQGATTTRAVEAFFKDLAEQAKEDERL